MVNANSFSAAATEADLFHCITCEKDFKRDEDLYKHLCSSGHPYCFYCGQNVPIPHSLLDHFKTNHSNFTCPECPKIFFLRKSWRNHMRSHWDYQPHTQLFLHDVMVPGESLQDFADRLSPSKDFYERCSQIINRIEKFMNHNTSYKNGSILMAGSVGKRTALGDGADVDMMYYINDTSFDDMINTLPTIINRLRQHVLNGDFNWASDLTFERTTPFSVQFKLSIGNQPHIPVDLLPVVDILKPNSKANRVKLYTRMITMDSNKQGYCKRCLSRVQVDFVRKVPRKLKDVIRVIKAWVKKIKKDERCASVLSYFCELVVIRTWMNQGEPPNKDIDLLKFVKFVLYELCFCEIIRITWPELYQHFDFTKEINGPMVLDPANPFCNVAPKIQHAAVISRKARQLLSKPGYTIISVPEVDRNEIWFSSGYDAPVSSVSSATILAASELCFHPASINTPTVEAPRVKYTSGTNQTEPRVILEMGETPKVNRCLGGKRCCVAVIIPSILFISLVCFICCYFLL